MAITNNLGQTKVGVRSFVFTPEEPGTPMTIDQDSTNFIIYSGLSDSVQISAIETLVSDLKSYGLWTKMRAIYPFVGGSEASHKLNLKDPRNLNAAYRLVFYGGWTHTSTGAKPNGTTGYADTFLNSNVLGQNDLSFSSYLGSDNTNEPNASCSIGAYSSGRWGSGIYPGANTGSVIFFLNGGSNTYGNNNTTRGMYMASKTTSFSFTHVRGVKADKSFTTSTPVTSSFKISKAGDYAGDYNPQEQRFIHIGDGLTDTEAANLYTAVQKFQTTLGRHVGVPVVADADAQAFLNAASITSVTQASAVNKLVTDLKSAGIWNKMKALYPFVGGSATSHKFNLKDPRDVDAAFRLQFNGGWTHTSTGATPNGVNGYADTKFVPSSNLSSTSAHQFFYFRNSSLSMTRWVTHGCMNPWGNNFVLYAYAYNIGWISDIYDYTQSRIYSNFGNSSGAILATRSSSSSHKLFRNNSQIAATTNSSNASIPSINYYIGALNNNGGGSIIDYDTNEISFTSLGDGLTDSESSAFYTAVETFQTTLGRNVGVPVVADGDAQAFLNAASITNSTQATAVNTLVTDLKTAGIWSKMKALYPFVGGTANSHKFNLKDPRDLDAAFRLVFNGGWTHGSTGATPNGTNGYADTKFIISQLYPSITNIHISYYSRTNTNKYEMIGMQDDNVGQGSQLYIQDNSTHQTYSALNTDVNRVDSYNTQSTTGHYLSSRTSLTMLKGYRNGVVQGSNITTSAGLRSTLPIVIGGSIYKYNSITYYYGNKESAFASIGDGLTDSESTTFYTAVQKFQTTLGRQV